MLNLTFAIALIAMGLTVSPPTYARGGVTGGGGNILVDGMPERPLEAEYVEHVIRKMKPAVQSYLALKERLYRQGSMPEDELEAYRPLFGNYSRVARLVEPVQVHVTDKTACFDFKSEPYDGSTLGRTPNSICMSAARIGPKVSDAELFPQASALMIHEFSEVLGLREEEALRIQKIVVRDLGQTH